MGQIEISKVASPAERDAFIKFPWRIYEDDPAWVAPLLLERKQFLDRKKHPFFEHGDAALFLARSGDQIVGRIMASDDPNYNALHQSNIGCFGLFESVNDPAVAAVLCEAAAGWLRAKGRNEIMGPIDYSTTWIGSTPVITTRVASTSTIAHASTNRGALRGARNLPQGQPKNCAMS